MTLYPLPLHLKIYTVVSKNPSTLRESSSHMAILGREEVHCGKGRLTFAELCPCLAMRSHLEQDILFQDILQLELSMTLHKPFSSGVHIFYMSFTHSQVKTVFLFSKFIQTPRPLKPKQRVPLSGSRCQFLIKVYPMYTSLRRLLTAPVCTLGMSL